MTLSIASTGAASSASIAEIVEKYGALPPGYLKFLATHDGATPPENVVAGTNNSIGVRSFIPASEILATAVAVDGMSSNLIPIADDEAGNFVCIGSDDHKLYFWDHEIDRNKVIADNFGEFLEKLESFDIDSVKLQPGQVKRIWVNPDFKPEF